MAKVVSMVDEAVAKVASLGWDNFCLRVGQKLRTQETRLASASEGLKAPFGDHRGLRLKGAVLPTATIAVLVFGETGP